VLLDILLSLLCHEVRSLISSWLSCHGLDLRFGLKVLFVRQSYFSFRSLDFDLFGEVLVVGRHFAHILSHIFEEWLEANTFFT